MPETEEKKVEEVVSDAEVKAVEEKPAEEEKEDVEMAEEKPVAPVFTEKEADEEENNDTKYAEPIYMSSLDATLNVLVSNCKGRDVVTPINADQLNLLAACRANVGISTGRYLIELEVLQLLSNPEILVGLSLETSSVFLGQKQSLAFTGIGTYSSDGEQVRGFKSPQYRKNDVIGLLLNRTDAGNANTVSLFINGKRCGEPQKIPESFDGALYPHVSVRNAIVAVNTSKELHKPLPFKCRSFGNASKSDLAPSAVTEVKESTVFVPFGMKTTEMIDNFVAETPDQHYVHITRDHVQKWCDLSRVGKQPHDDTLRSFVNMMSLRKRNYIYTGGNKFLLAKDRDEFCSSLAPTVKKVAIVSAEVITALNTTQKQFNSSDVTLPSKEDGFTEVKYVESEKAAKEALVKWQKQCKLGQKIENLKVGEWFQKKVDEYSKLRNATKAAVSKTRRETARKAAEEARNAKLLADGKELPKKKEEEKKPAEKKEDEKKEEEPEVSGVDTEKFTEEDWMLCDLRVDCHLLIHSFREDVEDKERLSFLVDHLPFYYNLYAKRNFASKTWGCKTIEEVFELIEETIAVEDKLMVSKKGKECDFDEIIQDTEDARQTRCDRIGAGDEGANLKFKARQQQPQNNNNNQNKGGKGKGRNNNNQSNQGPPRNNDMPNRPPRHIEAPRNNYNSNKGGGKNNNFANKFQQRPTGGKGADYEMRPIPAKRPAGNDYNQSAAKRMR